MLYLVQSEIRNYVKNESSIIKKGLRSINFIKAITAYACLQIMTYDTILKKRKLTLLYEGNAYLEPVPNKLIESEENEFFSIMNNQNDDINDDNELSSSNDDDEDSSKKKKRKASRSETTQLLLSTLSLSKNKLSKSESPLESDNDDKKSYLDEALQNMNNYSPSFASTISDKIDQELLSRASSQEEEKDSESSSSNDSIIIETNPEKYIYPKQHLVKNIAK